MAATLRPIAGPRITSVDSLGQTDSRDPIAERGSAWRVVGDTKLRASVAAPPLLGGSKVRSAFQRPGTSRDHRKALLGLLEAITDAVQRADVG